MSENGHKPVEVIAPGKEQGSLTVAERLEQYQVRFQPGQSGNPGGRTKIKILSTAARETLGEINPTTGLTYAQEIVNAQVKEAKRGNVFAARLLQEWTEGRISLSVTREISGEGAEALTSAKQKLMKKLIICEAQYGIAPQPLQQPPQETNQGETTQ